MNYIYTLREFLDGKKTYLVGFAMLILAYYNHDWKGALEALAIIFGRRAISKIS